MRRGVLVAGLIVSAFGPGPVGAQRAGAPKLGLDGLAVFRAPGAVAVLARATGYWHGVATRTEDLLGEFRYLPEYASAGTRGQVFELLESDPPGWPAAGADRFVAVPWSFGPGCAEEGWQAPEWVEPGDTVAFLLAPTRTGTRGDLPVFDVLGWHQPYPVGELIPFWRRDRESAAPWLTPREFFELLSLLPSELSFRNDPGAAVAPALAWAGKDPGRDARFPAAEILARWEELRQEWGGDPPAPGG